MATAAPPVAGGGARLGEGGGLLASVPPESRTSEGSSLGGEGLLDLGGLELDVDVEDQPGELLPDRVHEQLEHR